MADLSESQGVETKPAKNWLNLTQLLIVTFLFVAGLVFFGYQIEQRRIQPVIIKRAAPTLIPLTATSTPAPTVKGINLYNNPSISINHLSLGGIYMVAKTKEHTIYPKWQKNLEKTLQELERFSEREFPGMEIKTYVFPEVIFGDKMPEDYRNADFLPEIFAKEKTIQAWHSDPSRYKILLVYIDFLKGANEGGYGPSVESRYTINPASWLQDEAILGNKPYGLIGSAHELGHTLGIPHPWEMPENEKGIPDFGNIPGDIMGYLNSGLILDQVYFSALVKKRMGL